MKGLLVKDLRIIFRRKQQLLILLAICIMIAFSTEGSFVIGYTAILIGMLGLTPLVADERNNGFPFLFSLPVDVKTYVNERYLFCILADVLGVAFGTALFVAACYAKGNTDALPDGLAYAALSLPATLMLMLTILPVQMIFGIERSRIITLVLYGILFAVSAVIVKVVGPIDQEHVAANLPEWLLNPFVIAGGILVLALIVCGVLYGCCMKTMKNREF